MQDTANHPWRRQSTQEGGLLAPAGSPELHPKLPGYPKNQQAHRKVRGQPKRKSQPRKPKPPSPGKNQPQQPESLPLLPLRRAIKSLQSKNPPSGSQPIKPLPRKRKGPNNGKRNCLGFTFSPDRFGCLCLAGYGKP